MKSKKLLLTIIIFSTFILFACKTIPSTKTESPEEAPVVLSRKLLGQGILSPAQLTRFFMIQKPESDVLEILDFAYDYCKEASAENINSDVAFAQMCLETGYLSFGNLVTKEMHNYCGLGAMNAENPGCVFATRTLGIRAHIQHLQAYATTEDVKLNQELVDPRYSWVHKTKYVQDITGLSGTWATDPAYAQKIENILCKMESVNSSQ